MGNVDAEVAIVAVDEIRRQERSAMTWKHPSPEQRASDFGKPAFLPETSDYGDRRTHGPAAQEYASFNCPARGSGLFAELRRRNIGRVAILYLLVCWLIQQPMQALLPYAAAGGHTEAVVHWLMVGGFPLAMGFAWLFEMTPLGLRRTAGVDRRRSVMGRTAVKLDCAIVAVIALDLAFIVVDNFWLAPRFPATHPVTGASQAAVPLDGVDYAARITRSPSRLAATHSAHDAQAH